MGNFVELPVAKMTEPPVNLNRDCFEVSGINGYVLSEVYLPEEILIFILSHVEPKDLVFNCRRVCKTWCNVIDGEVWRAKLAKKKMDLLKLCELPWFVCFWVLSKEVLERNLIKNGCGQEKLAHWEILNNGGNKWTVEKPPKGSEQLPKKLISNELLKSYTCFATSYYSCSKRQTINLKEEGALPCFMKTVKPHITISEWYCGRFDCRSVYELKVTLLDENEDVLDEFEIRKDVGGDYGSTWEQIKHVFREHTSEVRFIEFYHGGVDSQFWQGHYGSKMTGASVTLSLP